jgi:putative transposase
MGLKTFKYRLYPSKPQERQMFQVLNVCCYFYNMCLEDRKPASEFEKRSVSKNDQVKQSRLYRQTFPQARTVFSQTLQSVAVDLSKAFDAFFRRVKDGEAPGYPRFKGRQHFHSFNFPQFGVGAKLDGRRLKLYGIGRVAVRWHREMIGKVKTVRILHKAGQWFACFVCEVEDRLPLPETGKVLGIDVGITALVTTSDGEKVENPRWYRESQAKLRRVQRSFARKQKGSKNRRKALRSVQRQQVHTANQRSDVLHKLSTQLIQTCDGVALEDLAIRNMVRNHRLSKSILDSGWGLFKQYLTFKAVNAGREIRLVNSAYTSARCSNCDEMFQDFDLSIRWVKCVCGLSLDRDHNAAINILKRAGWDTPVVANADMSRL